MKISVNHSRVQLRNQEQISVIDGKGARIACREGSVWITQHRDAVDVLLSAGEAFTLERNGVSIIQAMSESIVVVDAPDRQVQAAASRPRNLTAQAVLGFARRLRATSRSNRPLPVMERGSLRAALAVLGLPRHGHARTIHQHALS